MASVQHRSVHQFVLAALCAFAVAVPAAATAQGGPTGAVASDFAVATSTAITAIPAIVSETVTSAPAEPPFTSAGVAGVHTMAATDALPRANGRAESVSPAALARRAKGGFGQSEVLMIVGGAAVILGLVTDGAASDLLIIGGAGVGLFGLYQYLQ